jgi:hypothetical protein
MEIFFGCRNLDVGGTKLWSTDNYMDVGRGVGLDILRLCLCLGLRGGQVVGEVGSHESKSLNSFGTRDMFRSQIVEEKPSEHHE